MDMDLHLTTVQNLSAAGSYRELVDFLELSLETLNNVNNLKRLMELLDPEKQTLGYLYALATRFCHKTGVEAALATQLFRNFVENASSEQLQYAMHVYYELCHAYTAIVVSTPCCLLGIKLLALAIDKIRTSANQLTAIHADLCQLSLKSHNFKIARRYLEEDISAILAVPERDNVSTSKMRNNYQAQVTEEFDSKYFLLYYYYGGMILSAVYEYERALYYFEVCISVPAVSTSSIMVEAYKKFILLSLIQRATTLSVPKFAAQNVSRLLKPHAQFYHHLANAFFKSSQDQLREVVAKYGESFVRDKNMSLVKKVMIALHKKNILGLTKSFSKISLANVANRVQLSSAEQAENFILDMISAGELFASIDQVQGMVTFEDNPERYNTLEKLIEVKEQMQKGIALIKRVNKLEEQIMLDPTYVKKVVISNDDEAISMAATHGKLTQQLD